MSSNGFRSLADQVRSWPDDRLSQLLLARPDLATPAPHDSAQLAARAAIRSSLVRALDQLNRCELSVLDALVAVGQTTSSEVSSIIHAEEAAVEGALRVLEDLALAWRSVGGLRALTGVGEAMGGSSLQPFSPDRPSAERLTALIEEVSPEARALLAHVAEAGGEAQTGRARTTVLPADAETPAEELFSRRLLVPRSGGTCVVPGEVGVLLRGGRTTTERVDVPPEPATSPRDQALVDRTAAGAAFEFVRRTELLLDGWGTAPPAALRSGGLGVRELRATAGRLHVDEPTTALLVEVAVAAGLATTAADPEGRPVWLPTDLADTWAATPLAERWVALARAWLAMPRLPGRVGSRDAQGKAWNALVSELASAQMPETRRMTLAALSVVPAGRVLAPGTGGASVAARLAWERPRRPRTRTEQVGWTLEEAAALGVTGLGGLASYARALVAGADPVPTLADLLPQPVDHVLVQADLTAVAPGPLESSLARMMALVADVESRGGATVYRFTSVSVRRAMDVGWSAVELHDFVASVSRTPVPQPLTYLIDDTARTFGAIRVGYAQAFLRADDEHALAELLHHPSAPALGLRRVAPSVLVSSTPLDVLLPRLRELGAAPVVEAADGTVHVARPEALRARTPREHRAGSSYAREEAREEAREAARVAAVVAGVRAGDATEAERPVAPTPQPLTPARAVAALREAIDAGARIVLEYVDSRGVADEQAVTPVALDGGRLAAYDATADDVRTFAVARIRTIRPA